MRQSGIEKDKYCVDQVIFNTRDGGVVLCVATPDGVYASTCVQQE